MPTRVLIADGDTKRLQQAVSALQSAGFQVAATPDGGDAFARFFEELPEIVICTAALPSLSGFNLARMVRSQSPETRVVLLDDGSPPEKVDGAILLSAPLDVGALLGALPDLVSATPQPSAAPAAAAEPGAASGIAGELKAFQRGSSLLALLDDAGLESFARAAVEQPRGDGEQIIRQGDAGDGFYLLLEGEVRVVLEDGGGSREVARIPAGEFFGEMALLSNEPRSASVWSAGACRLLWFDKEKLLPLLERYPTMREVLSGVALERTEQNLWQVLIGDDEVQASLETIRAASGLKQEVQGIAASAVSSMRRVTARLGDMRDKLRSYERERRLGARLGRQVRDLALRLRPLLTNQLALGLSVGTIVGVSFALAVSFIAGDRAAPEPAEEPPLPSAPAAAHEASEDEPPLALLEASAAPAPGAPVVDAAALAAAAEAGRTASLGVIGSAREASTKAGTEERKALRKSLLAAYKAKKYGETVALGRKLRQIYLVDWEAYWATAEAERKIGEAEAAVASYRHFFTSFPTTVFTDDARFWAADLLVELGRADEAWALYHQVASDPQSNFQKQAAERLSRAGAPAAQ